MVIFDGEQPFESFYLKHFDTLQDLQNCTECFKNLSIYSSSIYYQTSQSNTGSFKRILAENDEWLDVTFWKNGGNYFTSSFKLGTLNSNELNLITSGSKRLTISPFGNIQISKSVNIDENLTISGSTTILSTLYDSLLEAGSTNQFLKSNNISGSQWTTIQMSHVSGLLNYTSSISSSFVDINNSLNSYTSSNNTSINNLNQVSASFKTFTSSLNIWTGSFSSSVNTQFSNINTSLTGLNTFSSSINSLTSSYFIQGGNSFGTSAILGTNDNQPLNLETSGSIRINISTLGDVVVFKGFEVKQNLLVRGSTFLYSALYDSNISAGSSTQFLRSVSTNGTVWTDIQMSHVSGLLNYTSSISSSLNSLNSYTSSNNTVLNNFSVYTSSLNVATGSFFRQGGNSFGTSGSLGTNDNNNLHIITSGSTRIFVSSSGAIGLGTLTPTTILHIYRNTTQAQSLLRFETNGANGRPYFDFKAENIDYGYIGYGSSGNNSMFIQNYLNADLNLGTNSITRLTVKSNGNVLIGTSTDTGYKLDISGTLRVTSSAIFNSTISVGTTTTTYKLNLVSPNTNDIYASFQGQTSVSGGLQIGIGGINQTAFLNRENTDMEFYNNGSLKMNIKANGNVLIGTSTDSGYKLDISGTLRNTTSAYFATTSGNVGIGTTSPTKKLSVNGEGIFNDVITVSSSVANEGGQITLLRPSNGTKDWAIDNYQSNFRILNDTDGLVSLIATSSGSVGIGTTTPSTSAKLDITSTISGVLFPRMTTTEKNAITGVSGLVLYDTTLSKLQIYTTTWENLH